MSRTYFGGHYFFLILTYCLIFIRYLISFLFGDLRYSNGFVKHENYMYGPVWSYFTPVSSFQQVKNLVCKVFELVYTDKEGKYTYCNFYYLELFVKALIKFS